MPTPECAGSERLSSLLSQTSVDRLKGAKQGHRFWEMRTVWQLSTLPLWKRLGSEQPCTMIRFIIPFSSLTFIYFYFHVILFITFYQHAVETTIQTWRVIHPSVHIPGSVQRNVTFNKCLLCGRHSAVCFRAILSLCPKLCEVDIIVLILQMISPGSQVDVVWMTPLAPLFPLYHTASGQTRRVASTLP